MGMLIYDALVLARVSQILQNKGRVLTLGVPRLYFDGGSFARHVARLGISTPSPSKANFSDSKDFFRRLGFEAVDALDVDAYEGANIVGNLNDRSLADRVPERYDLIFDAGTTEHVFDIPAALSTINTLLKPGGIVVHAVPANGFMDHGFWQVSPDAFKAFYAASGFSVLTSALFVLGAKPAALLVDVNLYRTQGRDHIMKNAPEAQLSFAARKGRATHQPGFLTQDYYKAMHGADTGTYRSQFFLSFGSVPLNRMLRFFPFRILVQIRGLLARAGK